MRITGRRGTIAFFITLGVCLVALAGALNVGWIILSQREVVLLVLGIIFFCAIMAGLTLNTIFLIREIRRNEQHDSFINAVSHELKTPIASLRLYLDTLRSRQLSAEQQQEYFRDMKEDVDRLDADVEQVLKAAEVRGRARRPFSAVNVEALAAQCAERARTRHQLSDEALRFQSNVNGTQPLVMGDEDDLRTAFNNVIDNAVKYSGDTIAVEVNVSVPDPQHVRVQVRDHGVGIPRRELKQVFRRFYRVKGRGVAGIRGSGLGLFIVRTIARRHGGRVEAHSEGEGRGTTVDLTLPRAK
jgi:two-component system sensor histidine kinase SenX3